MTVAESVPDTIPGMVVFISWSGEVSHSVAKALSEFIPQVIQAVTAWLSTEDITKGALWDQSLTGQLKECRVGISCLTAESLNSPWLLFEAGALSKIVDNSLVCPFLFRLNRADVVGPMSRFQSTVFEEGDVRRLLHNINAALGESKIEEKRLDKSFEKFWPDFKMTLEAIPLSAKSTPARSDRSILEEILQLVRGQNRRLSLQEIVTRDRAKLADSGEDGLAFLFTEIGTKDDESGSWRAAGRLVPKAAKDSTKEE